MSDGTARLIAKMLVFAVNYLILWAILRVPSDWAICTSFVATLIEFWGSEINDTLKGAK